jgi:hypothetical protein
MTMRKKLMVVAVAAACSGNAIAADDAGARIEELHETTLNLIQLLVDQKVLTQEAADAMLKKARTQAAAKVQQAYLPPVLRNGLKRRRRGSGGARAGGGGAACHIKLQTNYA